MVKFTPKKDVDAYYNSTNFSQSEGKPLLSGLKNYLKNKKFGVSGDGIKIGSAVDAILTSKPGQFEKDVHVSKLTKLPSEAIREVVLTVRSSLLIKFSNINGELDDESIKNLKAVDFTKDCNEEILNAVYKHDYQSNKKDETRIGYITKDGAEYFYDLVNSIGKIIYSQDEKTKIDKVVKSLRESKITGKYFDIEKQKKFKRVTFHYQYPIYFEYRGIACKALLDLVIFIFDEEDNLVSIEPIDLKTTYEDTLSFKYIAKKLRYDLQAAWYTLALTYAFRNMPNVKIKPFKFITESTTEPGNPLIYIVSESLLKRGKEGRPPVMLVNTDLSFEGDSTQNIQILPEVKGYEQMIDDYIFYQMNGFDKDRRIVENDGVFELDFD